jgi:hypothetical protein
MTKTMIQANRIQNRRGGLPSKERSLHRYIHSAIKLIAGNSQIGLLSKVMAIIISRITPIQTKVCCNLFIIKMLTNLS